MLRVLILVSVICAVAGCTPVSPGIAPAVGTATSAPSATSGPTSPASVGSATTPATSQPAVAPTLAQITGAVTPAETLTAVTTVMPGVTTVGARTPTAAMSNSAPTTGAVATPSQPVIVLERSGGFAGRTQTWTVYADGRVTTGQREGHVAPEQVSQVVTGLAALGFFNLQDAYGQNTQCRDCYNYRLTVNSAGQTKTVSFVDSPADMPAGLGEAMAQLNSLLASAK